MWRWRKAKDAVPSGLAPVALPVPAGMPWLAEAIRLLERGDAVLEEEEVSPLLRAAVRLDRLVRFGVPWCGLFVYHCLKTAWPDTRTPWLPMRARPWLSYGRPCKPQVGALAVFWFYHRRSPFGHSGFIWAEDEAAWHVVGGNQRNRVRIQRVGRARLLGTRWPEEAWPPPGLRRHAHPDLAAPFEFGEENDVLPAEERGP
jgi:uncharacterized protein (TIGR02594 family)